MDHSIREKCAAKVKTNGHSYPLTVRGGKWSGQIGSEARSYFEADLDPEGEMSLRVFNAERDAHHASNNGRVNGHSNGQPKQPEKPRADFPLSLHKATGRWFKKLNVDGQPKYFYFGYVADDPRGVEAEKLYLHDLPYLEKGEAPPEYLPEPVSYPDGLPLVDLADEFLMEKDELLLQGELSRRSYADYRRTCERLLDLLGKHRRVQELSHRDFRGVRITLSKTLGHVAIGNEMQRMRTIFKFGYDNGLLLSPVNFGTGFKKPKAKHIRKHRNQQKRENGLRMFQPEELRLILDALEGKEVTLLEPDKTGKPVKVTLKSRPTLRAMVLMGSNCGLGNTDLAELRFDHLDLERGWLDYPRPKTECERTAPLWPETIEAIKLAIEQRKSPKDPENLNLVFLTVRGSRWVRVSETGSPNDEVGKQFGRVLRELKMKRPGVGFYALRHGFETVGGNSRDQIAVNHIMGHVDGSMAGNYREDIEEDRLIGVAAHVRSWLWPSAEKWPGK